VTEGYRQTTVRNGSGQASSDSAAKAEFKKRTYSKGEKNMKRRLTILSATALILVFGATACGGVQEEVEKRAQEEVDKQRQRAEERVREEATQLLEEQ
jgi:cell division protein FtsB